MFIREFPDEINRKLKSLAALQGVTLAQLVIRVLTEYVRREEGKK